MATYHEQMSFRHNFRVGRILSVLVAILVAIGIVVVAVLAPVGGLQAKGATQAEVSMPYRISAKVRAAAPKTDRPARPPEKVKPGPDAVTLTFDDGPTPAYTRQVLDVLDRYAVKATFFMLGEMARAHPDLVIEVARRGHSIANHSMSHPQLTRLSEAAARTELVDTTALLRDFGHTEIRCMRPPYGAHNARTDALSRELGLEPIMWQVDTNDWRKPGAAAIAKEGTSAVGGQIVLMHDGGGDRDQTVAALPTIIEAIQGKKLRIESICGPLRPTPKVSPVTF